MTTPTFHSGWSMQPSESGRLPELVNAAGGWDNVLWSPKLDGFRVLVRVQGGRVDYFSRNGLPLPLRDFDSAILIMAASLAHLGRASIYFDCECCGTTFEDALSGKHGHAPLSLHVFDVPLDDHTPLRERLGWLETAAGAIPQGSGVFPVLHSPAVSRPQALSKYARAIETGGEGVVLKDAGSPYRAGTSTSWVRMVHRVTHDLPVVRVVEGKGRAAGAVGSFVCLHRGREIGVLPGRATVARRRALLSSPPAVIEVESRGETRDGALRHAAFVRARGDKILIGGHDVRSAGFSVSRQCDK